MNKKLIRLTESDLHRIVKESVNKVLNEVEYGGESFHGHYDNEEDPENNSGNDWYALSDIRALRRNHSDDYKDWSREHRNSNRDEMNSMYGGVPVSKGAAFRKRDRVLKNFGADYDTSKLRQHLKKS